MLEALLNTIAKIVSSLDQTNNTIGQKNWAIVSHSKSYNLFIY